MGVGGVESVVGKSSFYPTVLPGLSAGNQRRTVNEDLQRRTKARAS